MHSGHTSDKSEKNRHDKNFLKIFCAGVRGRVPLGIGRGAGWLGRVVFCAQCVFPTPRCPPAYRSVSVSFLPHLSPPNLHLARHAPTLLTPHTHVPSAPPCGALAPLWGFRPRRTKGVWNDSPRLRCWGVRGIGKACGGLWLLAHITPMSTPKSPRIAGASRKPALAAQQLNPFPPTDPR